MRDKFKKLTCIVAAATLAVTAASFAGCSDSYSNKVPGNDIFTDEAAVSNGGFAVEKGNYAPLTTSPYLLEAVYSSAPLMKYT